MTEGEEQIVEELKKIEELLADIFDNVKSVGEEISGLDGLSLFGRGTVGATGISFYRF